MSTTAIVIAAFLLVTVLPQSESSAIEKVAYSDRQLYRTIGEISFASGKFTKGLRISNRPKLNCVQGENGCVTACNSVKVDKMDCRQMECGERNALWKCVTSSIDKHKFSIQKAKVLCEGWDNTTDSHVSIASCSVEYAVCRVHGGGARRMARDIYFESEQSKFERESRRYHEENEKQSRQASEDFDRNREKNHRDFEESRKWSLGIFFAIIVVPLVAISIIVGIVICCVMAKKRQTDVPFQPPQPHYANGAQQNVVVQTSHSSGNPPYPAAPGPQPNGNPPYPAAPGPQPNGNPQCPVHY